MKKVILQTVWGLSICILVGLMPLLSGCESSRETHERKISSSLDNSPFGEYESAIIKSIEQSWYALIDKTYFIQYPTGEVVLGFNITSDGKITDMKVLENNVGEIQLLMCKEAVLTNAPYPPWPADMLRMVGKNYRQVKFDFHYD